MNKNQVLKQRTITAVIFGVVVITMLLSGKYGAISLFALIAGLCTYEYVRMMFPHSKQKLANALVCVFAVIGLTTLISPLNDVFTILVVLSMFAMILGIVNMFVPFINHKKMYALVSTLYFGLPLGLYISYTLHQASYPRYFCLLLICLIWTSDSFAYLFGSRIGKHTLLPRISPKKTWEGFVGGGLCTLIFGYIVSINYVDLPLTFWLNAAIIVWIIGTLGDLVESSIKRTFNIKDSGKWLPGHGGILDRFDSFVYILPFILFLLLQVQY
jgi:phosphatidate cytidylyltransferase